MSEIPRERRIGNVVHVCDDKMNCAAMVITLVDVNGEIGGQILGGREPVVLAPSILSYSSEKVARTWHLIDDCSDCVRYVPAEIPKVVEQKIEGARVSRQQRRAEARASRNNA